MQFLLLAQNVVNDHENLTQLDWEKVLFVQGPLYVIFLLLLYGIVKYVPPLITSHRELITTLQNTSVQNAESTERMSESLEDLSKSTRETHDDLKQLRKASKHALACGKALLLEDKERRRDSDVIIEITEAQKALNNDDSRAV